MVCRDLPVLREVFGDAVRYGTDPASLAVALDAAVGEPDPARSALGQSLAGRHSWRSAAEAHVELYERLAGARRPVRRAGGPW